MVLPAVDGGAEGRDKRGAAGGICDGIPKAVSKKSMILALLYLAYPINSKNTAAYITNLP